MKCSHRQTKWTLLSRRTLVVACRRPRRRGTTPCEGAPMLNTATPRTAERATRNAPKQDLRAWLAQMEEAGELVTVTGADRGEEIGGIVDIYQRTMGAPALMFQDIPGVPSPHPLVANNLTPAPRPHLPLGLPGPRRAK